MTQKEVYVPRSRKYVWNIDKIQYLQQNFGKTSTAEIAKHLGMSPGTVRARAHSMGIRVGRGFWQKKTAHDHLQKAIELYKNTNMSMQDCADTAGCGITTLHKYLKKLGLNRLDKKKQIGLEGEILFEKYCEMKGIDFSPINNFRHQYDYFIGPIGINIKHGETGINISSVNISRMKEDDEFWFFHNGKVYKLLIREIDRYEEVI